MATGQLRFYGSRLEQKLQVWLEFLGTSTLFYRQSLGLRTEDMGRDRILQRLGMAQAQAYIF